MKKILMFLMLMPLLGYALPPHEEEDPDPNHEFRYQGIMYHVMNEYTKTCMTKSRIEISDNVFDYTPEIDGKLIIPEYVSDGNNTYQVTCIGDSSFYNVDTLSDVQLPESILSIGEYAFSNSSLSSINLPSGLWVIGEEAFSGTDIESIEIPQNCRGLNDAAFRSCKRLKFVSLPRHIADLRKKMFQGCSALESIDIPDNFSVIHTSAFEECESLVSIQMPSSICIIQDAAFRWCERLNILISLIM